MKLNTKEKIINYNFEITTKDWQKREQIRYFILVYFLSFYNLYQSTVIITSMQLHNARKTEKALKSVNKSRKQSEELPQNESNKFTRYHDQKIDSYTKFDIKGIIRLQYLQQKRKQLVKSYNQGSNNTFRNCSRRQKKLQRLDMIIPSFQALNIDSTFLSEFNEFQTPNRSKQKNQSFSRPKTQSKNFRQLKRGTSMQDSMNLGIHAKSKQFEQTKVVLPKTMTKIYWQRGQQLNKDYYSQIHHNYQSTERKFRSKNIENILRRKNSNNFLQMMEEYRRRMKLGAQTKIFIFQSPDIWLKALVQKNWVQNADPTSKFYNLKWTSKLCLQKQNKEQLINHFYQSDSLTSKQGLAKMVRKSKQMSMFCPRSFDLGSEMKQFMRDYRDTQILGFLKKIVAEIQSASLFSCKSQETKILDGQMLKKQFERIRSMSDFVDEKASHGIYLHIPYSFQLCAFCQNIRCKIAEEALNANNKLDQKTLKNLFNFAHLLPPYSQYLPRRPKDNLENIQYSLHFNPQNINFHTSSASFNLPSSALLLLLLSYHRYFQQNLHTYRAQGDKNIWIVKNRNSSKGSGIYLGYQLHQLVKKTENKLIQKYVEQCALFEGRKYDGRVWVLVLCYDPLIAYFYQQFYCRLCAQPYNLASLQVSESHLTNYSKNRHTFTQQQQTILSYPKLLELASTFLKISIPEAKTYINQKLNKLVYTTLINYKNVIRSQAECFELYGFDVLITKDMDMMLVEVNLSPACSAGRDGWLQGKTKEMAKGLIEIVVEKADRNKARQMGWSFAELEL